VPMQVALPRYAMKLCQCLNLESADEHDYSLPNLIVSEIFVIIRCTTPVGKIGHMMPTMRTF
jgi:hypothetical protein